MGKKITSFFAIILSPGLREILRKNLAKLAYARSDFGSARDAPTRGISIGPPRPATPRARGGEEAKGTEEKKKRFFFFPYRRSVSLQKGTNQPATRMSLNRSQRSCRSTKYGTQAKT